MPINSVSPSFGGKITDIKTGMNMKRISKMLSPAYDTTSIKYDDGSFVVKGYNRDDSFVRQPNPNKIFEDESIWNEDGLECYVEYTPEEGLFTQIRSRDYDDVFYTITQQEGEDPKIHPVESEIELPNFVLNMTQDFVDKMTTICHDQNKIYDLLGTFIPTLENLKL